MIIALDFDNTYTRDPAMWNDFIDLCQHAGHKVYCVTMRYDKPNDSREVREALGNRVDAIYFTERSAKQQFMQSKGIAIDIWIDDCPQLI